MKTEQYRVAIEVLAQNQKLRPEVIIGFLNRAAFNEFVVPSPRDLECVVST